jgi:glycogen operon protein
MLPGAGEFGRNQGGNSNAYCQDNEVSWLDWESMGEEGARTLFSIGTVPARPDHPRHRGQRHRLAAPGRCGDESESLGKPANENLVVRVSGELGLMYLTERGEQEPDDTFLILLNAPQRRHDVPDPDRSSRRKLRSCGGYRRRRGAGNSGDACDR